MTRPEGLRPPDKLSAQHDVSHFDSGEPTLDEWLRRRALQNKASGASRLYVVCVETRAVKYSTLAVGAVALADAPGHVRRNMPDPLPVMVLGRLAVDQEYQCRGIGSGLLRDAILRTVQSAEIAGIRAILVHAISITAKRFYEERGFVASPVEPLTVMISVTEAIRLLATKGT